MARTPLASRRQDALSEAADQGWTRGTLLRRAGSRVPPWPGWAASSRLPKRRDQRPSIVVVGGGLAGLTAAYRAEAGRLRARALRGLRPRSAAAAGPRRGVFAEGQIAEHGGELIDQGHTEIRQLAQELGLDPRQPARGRGERDRAVRLLRRQPYSLRRSDRRPQGDLAADPQGRLRRELPDALRQLHPARARTRRDVDRRLDQGVRAGRDDVEARASCSTSPTTSSTAPSRTSRARSTCSTCSATRARASCGSSAPRTRSTTCAAATTRSRTRLAAALARPDQDGLRSWSRSAATPTARYELTLRQRAGTSTVTADQVVLALPFSILRRRSTTRRRASSRSRSTAISELGHGHELEAARPVHEPPLERPRLQRRDLRRHRLPEHLGGHARPARHARGSSSTTRAATIGASFGTGTPDERAQAVPRADRAGAAGHLVAAGTASATIDFWTGYQWTKGSYSYWKVGQYTTFVGHGGASEQGNCHFAGEHTSIDFQGYLNGAVETGQRAASEILADLK